MADKFDVDVIAVEAEWDQRSTGFRKCFLESVIILIEKEEMNPNLTPTVVRAVKKLTEAELLALSCASRAIDKAFET